jgi:hypothetical protein
MMPDLPMSKRFHATSYLAIRDLERTHHRTLAERRLISLVLVYVA